MNHQLLGFFSGFPNHRFSRNVADRLSEELTNRNSLVFISAWPMEYKRNDNDSTGMHGMFEECNMPFARYYVIDNRMEASYATRLIHEASCVFLMGGHPGQQFQLICNKGLDVAIRDTSAAILGVSAGAINMAKRSLDTKDSCVSSRCSRSGTSFWSASRIQSGKIPSTHPSPCTYGRKPRTTAPSTTT